LRYLQRHSPRQPYNRISSNTALGSGYYDLFDQGTDNKWWNNEYETVNW
jgi:hypothetical protein